MARAELEAAKQSLAFEDSADAFWGLRHRIASSALSAIPVVPATRVLAPHSTSFGLPNLVTDVVGLDPSDAYSRPSPSPESESTVLRASADNVASSSSKVDGGKPCRNVQESQVGTDSPDFQVAKTAAGRLAAATKAALRSALPFVSNLVVSEWPDKKEMTALIGVPDAWTARVSLSSLHKGTALFQVFKVDILIASDPEAPGKLSRRSHGGASSSVEHAVVLRKLANDRIAAAADAVPSNGSDEHRDVVMLTALHDLLTFEVCAPLVHHHLREQAAAMMSSPWSSSISVEFPSSTNSGVQPLILKYWIQNRQSASLRIDEIRKRRSVWVTKKPAVIASATAAQTQPASLQASSQASAQAGAIHDKNQNLGSFGANAQSPELESGESWLSRDGLTVTASSSESGMLQIVHNPPLPGVDVIRAQNFQAECGLNLTRLNLESLLLAAVNTRAASRLASIKEFLARQFMPQRIPRRFLVQTPPETTLLQYPSRATEKTALLVQFPGNPSSGVQVVVSLRTGGLRIQPYGSAGLAARMSSEVKQKLWTGDNHFSTALDEESAVSVVVHALRHRVKLDVAARSVCSLDIGVSYTLPPGTASVAATGSPDRTATQLIPPFAPLERHGPRRFVTLSPPPQSPDAPHGSTGSWLDIDESSRRMWKHSTNSRPTNPATAQKRPRLTYATTRDALVFIQESVIMRSQPRFPGMFPSSSSSNDISEPAGKSMGSSEAEFIDRYNGSAASAAAWAVTRDVVERRLRRDALLRAFVAASVASSVQTNRSRATDDGDMHIETASRTLLKLKCEPIPARSAELLLRGNDAWQIRLSLLPPIFDSTNESSVDWRSYIRKNAGSRGTAGPAEDDGTGRSSSGNTTLNARKRSRVNAFADDMSGNLWSVGVSCVGSILTFTYPVANAATVRSFFRDLTRARTAAALARGVPPSRFYTVLRRSPIRIVVGIGPFGKASKSNLRGTDSSENQDLNRVNVRDAQKPLYIATVEYVYSKGHTGGFNMSFSPPKDAMMTLAPSIEEALDASGGQVGGILAGLLERACPIAAAIQSALPEERRRIKFLTALRARAIFEPPTQPGPGSSTASSQGGTQASKGGKIEFCVDMDARGGGDFVKVIDVGRASSVLFEQGLHPRSSYGSMSQADQHGTGVARASEFASLSKWDEITARLSARGAAQPQRAVSTVLMKMEELEGFLTELVASTSDCTATIGGERQL